MTYNFSATQNKGRIVSSADGVTGENVSYTYDSLNRLIAAATTNTTGVQWNESYSFDGFGNLTSKVPTKGTAPQVYPQVNSATNQARMIGDYGFDANGDWLGAGGSQINTWNVENQLISNGAVDGSGNLLTYTYDPWGKRVLQYSVCARCSQGSGTLYFYSISGQRLGSYQLNDYPPGYGGIIVLTPMYIPQYFGRRMLVAMDRLGSVRNSQSGSMAYFPWGEERTSTLDGTDKFATYFRDGVTDGVGQDYARARYYNNNFGRFWSPDPAGLKAVKRRNPTSWNRYIYALNDPVNFRDPTGREVAAPPGDAGMCVDDGDGGDEGDGGGDGPGYDPGLCGDSGDDGSDGITPAAPAPTDQWGAVQLFGLSTATASQVNTLQAAYNQALDLINSVPECGGLFAGDPASADVGSAIATDALMNSQYQLIGFGLNSTSGGQTQSATWVQLNNTGVMFSQPDSQGDISFRVPSPTTGQLITEVLPAVDVGALTLLHELGHQVGIFGQTVTTPWLMVSTVGPCLKTVLEWSHHNDPHHYGLSGCRTEPPRSDPWCRARAAPRRRPESEGLAERS